MAARDELLRASAFEAKAAESVASRVGVWSFGTAVFSDRWPRVYDANFLRVESGPPLDAVSIAAEADEVQGAADLQHRRVLVHDDHLAGRLADDFRAMSWDVQRFLVMIYRETPVPGPSIEIDAETYADAHARFIREEPYGTDETVVSQLIERDLAIATALPDTRFVGVAVDDAIVSTCIVYSDGATAQIEAVGTLEAHRGHGHGRAVVEGALAIAAEQRCDFVFLVADADDWPKEMYARMGFAVAGRYWAFGVPGGVDFVNR